MVRSPGGSSELPNPTSADVQAAYSVHPVAASRLTDADPLYVSCSTVLDLHYAYDLSNSDSYTTRSLLTPKHEPCDE